MSDEVKKETVSVMPAEAVTTESDAVGADPSDVENGKTMGIVGYLFPIFFFVPMLATKKNPFAIFHAKQQFNLLLASFVVNIVGSFIPVFGWFLILPLGLVACLVLSIIGIVNVSKGEMRKLPLIGSFRIIE
jgi:uncharacterized membrane protein